MCFVDFTLNWISAFLLSVCPLLLPVCKVAQWVFVFSLCFIFALISIFISIGNTHTHNYWKVVWLSLTSPSHHRHLIFKICMYGVMSHSLNYLIQELWVAWNRWPEHFWIILIFPKNSKTKYKMCIKRVHVHRNFVVYHFKFPH